MTDSVSGTGDRAQAAVTAIHEGKVELLAQLLDAEPALVNTRFDRQRTLLHAATDWPGHFPNVTGAVALLLDRGANINASFIGRHSETPLHWAASSNDVAVIELLLQRGADIDATGGVIDGGTALADAVAFGQWEAARLLLARGAATNLWQAAALGLDDRVRQHLTSNSQPSAFDVTRAFWCACHGGQRKTAEYLLRHGADANWIGYDNLTPLDAARRSGAEALVEWLRICGGKSATEITSSGTSQG